MAELAAAPDSPVVHLRATPLMAWNGEFARASGNQTHYLHLSVFPCEKCHGPVIAGSMGTRQDLISKETDITKLGAVCIACGFRPEIMVEASVEYQFRPVEWNWVVQHQGPPAASSDGPPKAEFQNLRP